MSSPLDDLQRSQEALKASRCGDHFKPPAIWLERKRFEVMPLSWMRFFTGIDFVIVDGDANGRALRADGDMPASGLRATRLSFVEALALKRSQAPATG